jgi:hypothetical protein
LGQEPSQAQGQVGSGEHGNNSYHKPRKQKRFWKKGRGQPWQITADLSKRERHASQAQARPPHPKISRKDYTNQDQAPPSSVRAPRKCQKIKQEAGAPSPQCARNSSGDFSRAEAEDGEAGGSGLGVSTVIWPLPNAYPGGSELRMPTGPEATWGMEEPASGLPQSRASAWEPMLRDRERMPKRGLHRVQPVLRIIHTALGEPQECSTHEPLRE